MSKATRVSSAASPTMRCAMTHMHVWLCVLVCALHLLQVMNSSSLHVWQLPFIGLDRGNQRAAAAAARERAMSAVFRVPHASRAAAGGLWRCWGASCVDWRPALAPSGWLGAVIVPQARLGQLWDNEERLGRALYAFVFACT